MNTICKYCDTRVRLNLCNGIDKEFKYCFRKCGSIEGVKESIFQFNEISDLQYCPYIIELKATNFKLENYCDNIKLLLGDFYDGTYPIGFVSCLKESKVNIDIGFK